MLAFEREIGEGYLSTISTFLYYVCHPRLQGLCIKGAVLSGRKIPHDVQSAMLRMTKASPIG